MGKIWWEAAGTLLENYIYVDGIQNVIKVLEEVELGKMEDLIFLKQWLVLVGVWVASHRGKQFRCSAKN